MADTRLPGSVTASDLPAGTLNPATDKSTWVAKRSIQSLNLFLNKGMSKDQTKYKTSLWELMYNRRKKFSGGLALQDHVTLMRKIAMGFVSRADDGYGIYKGELLPSGQKITAPWGVIWAHTWIPLEDLLTHGHGLNPDGSINSGGSESEIVRLVEKTSKEFATSFIEEMEKELVALKGADPSWLGISDLVKIAPSTGTTMGIDVSDADNERWRNLAKMDLTSADFHNELVDLKTQAETYGMGPTHILAGTGFFNKIRKNTDALITKRRDIDSKMQVGLDISTDDARTIGMAVERCVAFDKIGDGRVDGSDLTDRAYLLNLGDDGIQLYEHDKFGVQGWIQEINEGTHHHNMGYRGCLGMAAKQLNDNVVVAYA